MALKRNRKGQFVKGSRKVTRKHRRSRKHVYATSRFGRVRKYTGARRRKGYRRVIRAPRHSMILTNPRRRRARRNPVGGKLMGLIPSKSVLKDVGFTVVGIAGTPFVEGFIAGAVPATIMPTDPTFKKIVNYAIKIGSAVLVGWGVSKVAGKEAGKMAYIGGASYVAVSAIKDFFPTLLPSSGGTAMYPAMSSQPLLGEYPGMGSNSPITMDAPERLRPQNRF